MSTEKLTNAISGISDRHITEFAVVKPVVWLRNRRFKIALAAACLCFAVTGLAFFLNRGSAVHVDTTDMPKPGMIIWGGGFGDNEWDDYTGDAQMGCVTVTPVLESAMEAPGNEDGIFAVSVTEAGGAPKENVYREFVKPLNVYEKYMETGIIFATAEQIESFVCPSHMAIVLSLAEEIGY